MKLSRKFVSDYLDLDKNLSITKIAEDMTSVGNEYDSASSLINCTNLVVGEVISCENHPDSDHLHCCVVDIGTEKLNIVCGAPNCRKGLKVIVAKAGAILPGGTIKKGLIRGSESNGMLCSLAELGLENKFLEEKDHAGIYEFPATTEIGIDAISALELDDEVIDFELTSNRGDLLSILGMAYELGAIYNKKVKPIDLNHSEVKENVNDVFKIKIETTDCPLFLAKKALNVTIKESPAFIKNRLIASGIRPINNVVDISNYVMLETGQPLHFYDANSLGDTLIVRNAKENETLTTLDNIKRTLSPDDIVISTPKEAVGLAGVMGGLSTEVENTTKDIIIESAIFDNIKIRKTSKKILRSEASNRFEKGLDPNRTYMAIERSCALLEKYAKAKIMTGTVTYDKVAKENKKINLSLNKLNKVLGITISEEEVISILERLAFTVTKKDSLEVEVPTRRRDISIEEDLIEEVGRIYGMDNIKGKLPVLNVSLGAYNKTKRALKHQLASLGLNETMSYTLIPKEHVFDFTTEKFTPIYLNDAMSEDRNTLRNSLLYSLKEIYLYNKARNNTNLSLFEIAKCFYKENTTYKEELHLGILLSGDYFLDIKKERVDFYILKGIAENILDFLGYENRYSFLKGDLPKELHPGMSACINVGGTILGFLGHIHPETLKDDVYLLEINLDKLLSLKTSKMKYKDISKYPSIIKDIAFIVDKDISSKEIIDTIKKASSKRLTNIELFDLYTGDKIASDKKSLAYKLTFMDTTKTLTEEEVMLEFNSIIDKVEKTLKATLRDK